MYKVKDAADQLGVTRVEIFEILLSQRELFDPYVVKKNSITYISDEGMTLLGTVIKANDSPVVATAATDMEVVEDANFVNLGETPEIKEEAIESMIEPVLESSVQENDPSEVLVVANEELQINHREITDAKTENQDELSDDLLHGYEDDSFDFDNTQMDEEDLERISDSFFSNIQENPSVNRIESEDLLVGQWLKEIQTEDEQALQLDLRLKEIRGQVTGLRNKILVLDSEIKRKDEAIKHYHEIMKDDLRWLEDMERKVQLIVKNQLAQYEAEETVEAITESISEDDKGNFFKFFKR